MVKKLVGTQAVELMHTTFGKGPEALDAVYVIRADGKLIIAMIDTQILRKTDIDQTVVATPTVGVDNYVRADFSANNGLQRGFLAIRNDLGIDPAVAFENAEDDRLAACPATTLAANTPASEIGLVHLNLSSLDRGVTRTFFDQADTDFLKDLVNAFPGDISQFGCFAGRQIHCEIPQYLAKLFLGNSGTAIIPV